jgi:hypothetical protein
MIFRPFYRFETGCAAYVFGCGSQDDLLRFNQGRP